MRRFLANLYVPFSRYQISYWDFLNLGGPFPSSSSFCNSTLISGKTCTAAAKRSTSSECEIAVISVLLQMFPPVLSCPSVRQNSYILRFSESSAIYYLEIVVGGRAMEVQEKFCSLAGKVLPCTLQLQRILNYSLCNPLSCTFPIQAEENLLHDRPL